MDQDTLIKRLMATFLEELEEHVGALNRDLLGLEKGQAEGALADPLRALFRTAHSLKGAARAVNVDLIERACHHLEEVLAALRDGRTALGPEIFDVLFATADAIEEAGMRLREQQDLTGTPLAALLPRLEAAAVPGSAECEVPAAAAPEESIPAKAAAELPAHAAPRTPHAAPEEAGGPATVRIAAEKLDTFLTRNGELLVARRRVESRAADLTTLREFVSRWKGEWRNVQKPLAEFLRATGVETEQAHSARPVAPAAAAKADGSAARLPRRAALALLRVGDNLRQMEKDLEHLTGAMVADGRILKEAAGAVDEEVRRVRMLPFSEACQGLDRMVRDLALSTGKEVELVVEGGDVELDRSVLEGLKDPLRHLVRNAVDHGAEPPEARRTAGKPRRMRLTVAAVLRGATVEVAVEDDGRGLDCDALRQQVRKRQLPEPADERELARVIFLPGFSTARLITDVSGRGVGLDVVKGRVEALHGTVDLSFTAGRGTRFTLGVPLTLTTLRALLVAAAGQTFAFLGATVKKLVRVDASQLRAIEGREMLALGGTPVPIASLAETLGLPGRESLRSNGKTPAVVVAAGDQSVAFVVDEFLAEQEVVVKGLGARIGRLRHVSAATILPSGRIALVLNAANLIRTALRRAPASALAPKGGRAAAKAKKRILVVDDSVTTRTLEKSILEAAGYEVTAAADGVVAWQSLQDRGADLIVSDVDMPRMDGFALTEAVRASKRFRDLPVILVTARETEADKARGIAVQANAYLGKSGFDQKNLLQTIAQLL